MPCTVSARTIALPWERRQWDELRTTRVGLEADVRPEPGPLALYQRMWPERYLTWSYARQLFEIRQVNPITGHDERYEFVDLLAYQPDGDQVEYRSQEELQELLAARDPHVRRVFRPFDYDFVLERLAQWMAFRAAKGAAEYARGIREKNDELSRRRMKYVDGELEYYMRHEARYHEVNAQLDAGVHPAIADTYRVPFLRVGTDLKAAPAPAAP